VPTSGRPAGKAPRRPCIRRSRHGRGPLRLPSAAPWRRQAARQALSWCNGDRPAMASSLRRGSDTPSVRLPQHPGLYPAGIHRPHRADPPESPRLSRYGRYPTLDPQPLLAARRHPAGGKTPPKSAEPGVPEWTAQGHQADHRIGWRITVKTRRWRLGQNSRIKLSCGRLYG
jgi:hypothetical protein